jgi:hypothetical protein
MSTLSQFSSGAVKSIQRGTLSISSSTTGTATISSVNTSKTELRYLGISSGSAGSDVTRIVLTNATTITATCGSSITGTVSWELTEFF